MHNYLCFFLVSVLSLVVCQKDEIGAKNTSMILTGNNYQAFFSQPVVVGYGAIHRSFDSTI